MIVGVSFDDDGSVGVRCQPSRLRREHRPRPCAELCTGLREEHAITDRILKFGAERLLAALVATDF